MLENWNDAIVTDINMAIYVAPGMGDSIHSNRRFHGFVINDGTADKKIYFSDGTVIRTGPYDVHYLPKDSNYRVDGLTNGGCYAINFDLLDEINEKPFNINFRNHESILKVFKEAVSAYEENKECSNAIIRKCIYDIIVRIIKECKRSYIPSKKELLIKPAVDTINRDFTNNKLSVKGMAELCGISEAYFRRIFIDKFSLSPKEYITSLRLEYAKKLLSSGQFCVGDVAFMCGYSEACHFSREFKKHFGASPAEYIK